MEDNLVDITEKDVGPGGKVTGLFFGFVLLMIAIWGMVINPMSRQLDTLEDRVITLEEAQKTLRENSTIINNNTKTIDNISIELDNFLERFNDQRVHDADAHARFDERISDIEEKHK